MIKHLERLKIFQIVHVPSAEYIKLDFVFYTTCVSLRWGKNLDNIVIIGSLFVLVTKERTRPLNRNILLFTAVCFFRLGH